MPFNLAMISEKGYAIDISSTKEYAGREGRTDFFQGTLGSKDIRRASAALGKSGSMGERMKKKINAYVGLEVARNFAEGKDSNGRKWAPLKESTIRKKTKADFRDTRVVVLSKDKSKKARLRLDRLRTNIEPVGGKFVVPLVETGNLFKSVTTPVTRTIDRGGAKSGDRFKVAGTGGVGLVVSERQKFVNFSPTPKGKNWDKKFETHNKPTTQSDVATRIPGREFFYVSDSVLEFTALLIGMARLVGTKQLKKGTTEESTPFFSVGKNDFRPRTTRGQSGGRYKGEGGRTPGRGGRVEFTRLDFVHWVKNGSRKFNAKHLGLNLNEKDETKLLDYFDFETMKILDDSRIFAFMKAADAVSAARAVGKKNRGKGNAHLKKVVKA